MTSKSRAKRIAGIATSAILAASAVPSAQALADETSIEHADGSLSYDEVSDDEAELIKQTSEAEQAKQASDATLTRTKADVEDKAYTAEQAQDAMTSADEAITKAEQTSADATSTMASIVSDAKSDAQSRLSYARNAEQDALKEQETAQQTLDEANVRLVTAEDRLDKAEQAFDDVDRDVEAITTQRDTAKKELDEAQSVADTSHQEVSDTTEARSQAVSDNTTSIQEVKEAQGQIDVSNVSRENAQKAYDEAVRSGTSTGMTQARESLTQTENDEKSAEEEYRQSTSKAQELTNEVNNAQSAYNSAHERTEQAERDRNKAENAYSLAGSSASDFDSTPDGKSYLAMVMEAEKRYQTEASKQKEAEQVLADAQSTLDEAQQALRQAKDRHSSKQYVRLEVEHENTSIGFMQWLVKYKGDTKAQEAYDIISGKTDLGTDTDGVRFYQYTADDIDDERKAQSLDNFERALYWIQQCNVIRKNEGKSELQVGMTAMAIAEVNANWTYRNFASRKSQHAVLCGESIPTSGENAHEVTIWDNPFDDWYTEEKHNAMTHNGGQTGHYENIIDDSYYATGYGCETSQFPNMKHVQEFVTEYDTGDVMSIEEVTSLLNEYRKAVTTGWTFSTLLDTSEYETAVTTAQSKYDEAKKKHDSVTASVTSLKKTYDKRQKTYDNLKAAYDASHGVNTSLKAQYEEAEKAYQRAQTAEQTAERTLNEKKSAMDEANRSASLNKQRYEQAKRTISEVRLAYETALRGTSDINEARQALEDAIRTSETAQARYAKAVNHMSETSQRVNEATKASVSAQEKVAQADEMLRTRRQAFDSIDRQYQRAITSPRYVSARRDLDLARDEHEKAKTDLTNAQTIFNEKSEAVKMAKDGVNTAWQRYEQVRGVTLQGILNGTITTPSDIVSKVNEQARRKAEAEKSLPALRKAYQEAEKRYGIANEAYINAKTAYEKALLDSVKANETYAMLLKLQPRHKGNSTQAQTSEERQDVSIPTEPTYTVRDIIVNTDSTDDTDGETSEDGDTFDIVIDDDVIPHGITLSPKKATDETNTKDAKDTAHDTPSVGKDMIPAVTVTAIGGALVATLSMQGQAGKTRRIKVKSKH